MPKKKCNAKLSFCFVNYQEKNEIDWNASEALLVDRLSTEQLCAITVSTIYESKGFYDGVIGGPFTAQVKKQHWGLQQNGEPYLHDLFITR